jgi:hypothetical protein
MDDCIIWTKALTAAGYGVTRGGYVHRLAYEAANGPIPDGLELDHLCRNRACYNVLHLEPVTHAENMRRGFWGSKTECPQGHPYDDENTIRSAAGRGCRECKNARRRKGAARPKTHCAAGHLRSPENKTPSGHCRECRREQNRAYKARLAASV